MRMNRVRRIVCAAALFAMTSAPALAQSSFSPANAICGLINFQFCDQGVPSTPPHADAAPAFAPPPPIDQKAAAPLPEKHKTVAIAKKRAKHTIAHSKKPKPKAVKPSKAAD